MFKRMIIAAMTLVAIFSLVLNVEAANNDRKAPEWLIYIYSCGTNLEDEFNIARDKSGKPIMINGYASRDIFAMQNVKLPPNVKVLINANGAEKWAHPTIQNEGPGIYLLFGNGYLNKISNWKADMGDPNTLKEFLKFGEEHFTADRRILMFFDHGGLNGLCYDGAFDGSADRRHNLKYSDLTKVLSDVYKNRSKKPFELIGFDICLSSSYELAKSISNFSNYMVGSEPSCYGWYFAGWLEELAKNPYISGAQIGKVICDSTMDTYKNSKEINMGKVKINNGDVDVVATTGRGSHPIQTYSVINLAKMPELSKAYDRYFNAANKFKGTFAHAAELSTTAKYSDLQMDLGTLAENTKDILPKESQDLLDAIQSAVVYHNNGEFLNAHGISTYYPYVLLKEPDAQKKRL